MYTSLVMGRLLASALFVFLVLSGCHAGPAAPAEPSTSAQFKVYPLRGKLVSTNAATGEATVRHQDIPGFMKAMTMTFKLQDARVLRSLAPGDMITAELLVPTDPDAEYLLDHVVVVAEARPHSKSNSNSDSSSDR